MMESHATIIIAYNRKYNLKELYLQVKKQYNGPIHVFLDFYSHEFTRWAKENLVGPNTHIHTARQNLGLKRNVLRAMKYAQRYRTSLVLEDDLILSDFAYESCQDILETGNFPEDIAQLSLFLPNINEFTGDSLDLFFNSGPTLKVAVPSSQGFIITHSVIKDFLEYTQQSSNIDFANLPDRCENWGSQSWKLLFFDFMIKNNLYTIYPYKSLSTSAAVSHGFNRKATTEYAFSVTLAPNSLKIQHNELGLNKIMYNQYYEPESEIFIKIFGLIPGTNFRNVKRTLHRSKNQLPHLAIQRAKYIEGPCYPISQKPLEANLFRSPIRPTPNELVLGITKKKTGDQVFQAAIDLGNLQMVQLITKDIIKRILRRLSRVYKLKSLISKK